MTIIIGIDPGSCVTGYGVIKWQNNEAYHLASGFVRLNQAPIHERLTKIYLGIREVVDTYKPQEASIEKIFMHQNPESALKLGQARGAAIVALDMPVAEYSARQVKQSVVGYGAAKKIQIQAMVKILLSLSSKLQADAADALAVALCHAHSLFSLSQAGADALKRKKSSWRDYQPETE